MHSLQSMNKRLLELLLIDRSTNRNIVWATNDYAEYGEYYAPNCEITIEQIIRGNADIIKPRITKAKEEQNNRTRDRAEVFTPSWICNAQNNLIDEQWFGRKDVFNIVEGKKWTAIRERIIFPIESGKTWEDYVKANRMEITCGEAPYLVSRYDTVSGEQISDIYERVGLLDRKLRIICENIKDESEWLKWVKIAYQSIYGFEYQGDNLFLARENLLFTFEDYLIYQFNRTPTDAELCEIAEIISWNIWQMDGLTFTAPYSETESIDAEPQLALFSFGDDEQPKVEKEPIFCVIKDWFGKGKKIEYRTLLKKR